MGKMKANVFVEKAVEIAKNFKTLYVMGCFGAPLTGSNVSRYCNNHSYNRAADRTAMIKAAGNQNPPVYGFDCVCLIKGILWGWSGNASKTYGGANYASNGVPDIGADTMITRCLDVSATGWANMAVGEAVWMSGHIGIYIGDGLAVECSPKWENKVQITAVGNIGSKAGYNTRTWTKHGKLPYVDYSESGTTTGGGTAPQPAAEIAKAQGIRVYTIGVGTEGMAPYPAVDIYGTPTGGTVMAKVEIDEKTLRSIAEQTGGQYFRATDKAKLKAIYDQINQLEKSKVEVTEHVTYHEQFLLWALAGLGLLVLEFLFSNLVLKRIP